MMCRYLVWLGVIGLCGAAIEPGYAEESSAKKEIAVAILGFEGLGLGAEEVHLLEDYFVKSVDSIRLFRTIPPLDIELVLEDPRRHHLRSCREGVRCAVQIGRLVGADQVVYGVIAAFGQRYSLNLRVVSVAKKSVVAKRKVPVDGSKDALIPEVRLAAYELLAPDKMSGSLVIRTELAKVDVWVDQIYRGQTPLKAPVHDLAAGEHMVELSREGYQKVQQRVQIKAFDTKVLNISMK